ncbi:NUDIX hydrolase [Sphingomonas spermidinifaciens]|uniref:GDP-mannose pyrophosphatase n=1 Tax=Sphingomonas spermidinifaciens TaxID=1141889 RepID=A0A2A4B9F3_9SPHN|nr:NUDIX hydrolase [Sphingomonas spermidinifaciens]PCD04428.1 NUDIX hydrolase [Sphingomonas spermidinifaciens]
MTDDPFDRDRPVETMWAGRWLEMKRRGRWEYVSRTGDIHAAVILAVQEGHVLLVEQYRVPLGRTCIELPAGLVGDEKEGEDPVEAARRELEEETGWRARVMEPVGEFWSSPGMASEGFTLMRATDLIQVGDGGGVAGEGITVHRVALADLAAFVAAKRGEGCGVDVKLLALLGPALLEGQREGGSQAGS